MGRGQTPLAFPRTGPKPPSSWALWDLTPDSLKTSLRTPLLVVPEGRAKPLRPTEAERRASNHTNALKDRTDALPRSGTPRTGSSTPHPESPRVSPRPRSLRNSGGEARRGELLCASDSTATGRPQCPVGRSGPGADLVCPLAHQAPLHQTRRQLSTRRPDPPQPPPKAKMARAPGARRGRGAAHAGWGRGPPGLRRETAKLGSLGGSAAATGTWNTRAASDIPPWGRGTPIGADKALRRRGAAIRGVSRPKTGEDLVLGRWLGWRS